MKVDLDAIEEAMSDNDRSRLVEFRGGCMCPSGFPPCGVCCNPLTEYEADCLGLIPEDPGATEMDAVRALCQPKGLK